jgi:hypothetical protein
VRHRTLPEGSLCVSISHLWLEYLNLCPFQYILPPKSVAFAGCVGDEDLAEKLKAANKREGLTDAYLVKPGEKTGACAVVITGQYRFVILNGWYILKCLSMGQVRL